VWLLQRTRVTPNQVSFAAIAVAAGGAATLIAWRSWAGLIAAGLILQLAYVIDCVDGQLARVKNLASPVGALLDFMLDEVKAFLVIGAASVRLWWTAPAPAFAAPLGGAFWLIVGVGGLFAAATGITLTTFMRRPEYLEATGAPALAPATERGDLAPRSLSPLALIEALGRLALHYPSWFLIICAFNRLDIFIYVYIGAHALYLARSSLIVLLKLGRGR
jgi:phosphatidylglycerophosphate synthase